MYLPSDDSILLADCLKEYHGNSALDIGLGSGIIAETLCRNFEYVVGSDIVIDTLESYKENSVRYQKTDDKRSKYGYGFELVCSETRHICLMIMAIRVREFMTGRYMEVRLESN